MSISIPWRLPIPGGISIPSGLRGRRSADKPRGSGEGSPAEKTTERTSDPTVARKRARTGALTRARFGGGDQRGHWVTVYSCDTIEEAHVVRGALEAEGIPVIVFNQAMSHLLGASAMWAVEVRVPARLEERARNLIES